MISLCCFNEKYRGDIYMNIALYGLGDIGELNEK